MSECIEPFRVGRGGSNDWSDPSTARPSLTTGTAGQQEGWGGGLGRLLAEALEGVGGKEGAAGHAQHPDVLRADALLKKVSGVGVGLGWSRRAIDLDLVRIDSIRRSLI